MTSLGGWCHLDKPYVAEAIGAAGFDWCCLDMQHGLLSRSDLAPMIYALEMSGCNPVVRVPDGGEAAIGYALDAGCSAVIVPKVSSAAQARAVSSHCHYPPLGSRSWGSLRAKLRPGPTDVPSPGCLAMIEDKSGLAAAAEIAATRGITGLFLGPADLALSLWGDPRRTTCDEMLGIGTSIASICADTGITAGVFAGSAAESARWARAGFQMIALEADSTLLARAAKAIVQEARRALVG